MAKQKEKKERLLKAYPGKEFYKTEKSDLREARGIKNMLKALKLVKINKLLFAAIIIIFTIDCSITVGQAYLSKLILDQFTSLNFEKFYIYAIIHFGTNLVSYFTDWLYMVSFDQMRMDLSRQLKYDVYNRINMIKVDSFSKNQTSTFTRRLGDATSIAHCFDSVFNLISRLVRTISYCVMLMIASPLLFAICAGFYLVKVICSQYYIPKGRVLRKRQQESADKVANIAMESVRGIRDVRSLNMMNNIHQSYVKSNDEVLQKEYGSALWSRKWHFSTSFISFALNNFVFMMLAAYLLIEKSYDAGVLLYYWTYKYQINGLFNVVFDFQKEFTPYEVSASRMLELYDEEKYPIEKFGDTTLERVNGDINFKHVNFRYDENKEVLNDISFKIKAHKTTAFVGKTGCGKSTILALIAKFYDITGGEITIDGISQAELSGKTLRSNIGYVQQDPYIFNCSFKDNLKMVKHDATDEELEMACEKAQIHDFIMSTKDAYDTLIGENGITLSGGQKQRLAIARALLNNSSVIMFDESTSSLDNENQAKIQEVISTLSKDHTIIVVAHRLSTIINADKIIFIEDGKVKAEGTHEKLYKTCKEYKNLYKMESEANS